MSTVCLEVAILDKLSPRGILAYAAVSLAGNVEATTAALAGLVRVQTAVMLDGLKELAITAPGVVAKAPQNKWQCGQRQESAVQILESSRYRDFVDDCKTYWGFLNSELKFAWGGTQGVAAQQWLREHPDWTREQWQKALKNRIISVVHHGNASRTEGFHVWLRRLDSYAGGPLNEYNRPVEGTGLNGKASRLANGNRSAREEYLASAAQA